MGLCVLTGASSGIGRAVAEQLAGEGERLALVARREPLLRELAGDIAAAGGEAHVYACDVTDRDAVANTVGRIERELGNIDRLVANAGGGSRTPGDAFDAARVAAMLELNTLGVAHCVEAVLPGMLARGRGHLVVIASLAGWRGLPRAAGYSASKAATIAMMESLRIDLAPRGIDVSIISPGFVRTREDKKRKPFQLELPDAAARICRAIHRRTRASAFPLPLVLATAAGRIMPAALYDRLLRRRPPPSH
ncbi:MAG: SDR family NAD(P)-dependent oxidoreductase [Gammaproteobacteria bacterium]